MRRTVTQLVEIGAHIAIFVPKLDARRCGFLPGSNVRLILNDTDLRVVPVSAPCAYDLETLDQYRERQNKLESDSPERWEE